MARGRMISKDISLDEKVDALSSDTARLLFTWMIPHLDCEGRMYGGAQVFKSIVAPRRNISTQKVQKILMELEKHGLIFQYSINGNQYICAPNFEKHQSGLRKDKETQSQIPPIPPDSGRSKDGVKTDLVPPKRSLSLKEENIYIVIFEHWNNLSIKKHQKLTSDMKRVIDSASQDYSEEELKTSMSNYAVIVKGKEYYLDYLWTLVEFLSRGKGNNIERFIDLETAKSNFTRGKDDNKNPRALPKQYTRPEDL
tara:strand:+ start:275 stop:1036 length:762 start_codon:yes stop_codon:yes gene_type:complete